MSVDLIKRSFVISVLILEKMGELVWVSVYEILEIMLQQRYKTKIYNSPFSLKSGIKLGISSISLLIPS